MAPSTLCFRILVLLLGSHAWVAALDERMLNFGPGMNSILTPEYVPHPSGIPFTIQNYAAQPWHELLIVTHQPNQPAINCATSSGSSKFWYEEIEHNGESSFLVPGYKDQYKVFRNVVKDYGADNTGQTDSSSAIQSAIRDGPSGGPARDAHAMGTTGQPAIVYLPGGTYMLKAALQLYVGTVLVGDATNPPVLKAEPGFAGDHIIYAKDPNFGGTTNFYIGIKNLVLDSMGLNSSLPITLLDWTVSQSTQLSNVVFNMPQNPTAHVGLTTQYDYNSNIIVNDLRFNGGNVGMKLSGQQWVFKNIIFNGTNTGVIAGGTDIVFLGCQFNNGHTGIDATGTTGSLTVVDSSGSELRTFVVSGNSDNAGNSIILENIQNSGVTVSLGGKAVLNGSVLDTWVRGDLYTAGNAKMQRVNGQTVTTPRSPALLTGGKYFIKSPPTYQEYSVDQVLNIKKVQGRPVYGDGATDDTQNINGILAENADCKVIYFPAGTYMVTDTIFVPVGKRIVGDSYASSISGVGSKFQDQAAVRPMVKFGYPGDVGVMQVSDMIFTVGDILPGCKIVEVNIAGTTPGDVGFWNTHIRIGGAVGSKVESQCTAGPEKCKAAWAAIHLTSLSSAYIENMWGWTADHDLDGSNGQTISTGRGLLVEATAGTWLVGTAFEHHTLYQYNFESARNVFSTMQQSESPYWQGPGNALAPSPWQDNAAPSDPDFSQCAAEDALCRMALFERIRGSSNLFLYGGCNWVFFNNNKNCNTTSGKCQRNALQVLDSSAVYIYGTNTKSTINMVLEGSRAIATEDENAGGWGGVIAAYLYNS
ncbi:pectate lyase superfamily protein-domain-containing protein [Aspergillus cavernicola]|uniref:Pectate lyase superfamily protein-domain-containing protein n=1 Tax=Aspergillus cavernicola TaxID=176166 RepID=A0ABR4ITV6_9EURO